MALWRGGFVLYGVPFIEPPVLIGGRLFGPGDYASILETLAL